MHETPFSQEYQLAVTAARAAGDYLQANRHRAVIEQIKSGFNDYATAQDLEAEKRILDAIRQRFPTDAILSEESHTEPSDDERLWIVDPLDGTRNYAHGLDHFAVSIAFQHAGRIEVAAVYIPCDDEMFSAQRGHGAFLNETPLSLSSSGSKSLQASIVSTGFSYYHGPELHPHIETFERVMNATTDVLRLGSAAADMCYVAAGRFGAYYESGVKPWDFAAASLLVQEAGGLVSNLDGTPLDLFARKGDAFSVDALAAANARIYDELLALLRPR